MAAETLNFMGGNVVKVHLFTAVTAFEQMRLGVTLDADVVHDMAVTVNDTEMALFTVDAAVNIIFMNKRLVGVGIDINLGSVRGVTGLAVGNLQVVFSVVEMTHETGGFSNRQVFALNNLRVAADTFQFFTASQTV